MPALIRLKRHAHRCAPFLVAGLAAACGGGDGGPNAPAVPALGGRWTGEVVYRSAMPAGHCYSDFLGRIGSHLYRVEVDVTQQGTRLEGTLRGTHILTTCAFAGQVSGSDVTWTQTTCAQPCTRLTEGTCPTFQLCVTSHSFAGQASAGQISGRHTLRWETSDPATGAALGPVDLAGTLTVRR